MNWRVELETRAKREFLALAADLQTRISEAIEGLAVDPRPPGSKKLSVGGGYRIRVGRYRVLYTVEDRLRRVRIYRVAHRRDVYRSR